MSGFVVENLAAPSSGIVYGRLTHWVIWPSGGKQAMPARGGLGLCDH